MNLKQTDERKLEIQRKQIEADVALFKDLFSCDAFPTNIPPSPPPQKETPLPIPDPIGKKNTSLRTEKPTLKSKKQFVQKPVKPQKDKTNPEPYDEEGDDDYIEYEEYLYLEDDYM